MPTLPNLDAESWKYSNINAVLKKLDVVESSAYWEMSGAYEYLQGDNKIVIPRGKQVSLPMDIRFIGRDKSQLKSSLSVVIEDGASLTLIERQSGEGEYWKDISLDITVGMNGALKHYRFCEEDPFCVVTERTTVHLARDARYHVVVINGCAGFGRSEFTVGMEGEGSECDLSGLTLLSGKQHCDTTVCVDHKAAHCKSSQFFKTILNDNSRGVYQGKIHVHKDAQKTDGYQLSNNLLLSGLSEMDVKPELEIYADDVKCSHGATTGELDETPLFYLMSRGIPEDDARRLLLEAFLSEVLYKIEDESVRELFEGRVKLWLK